MKSYDEIINFLAAGMTPESFLVFRPCEESARRVAGRIAKSKDGTTSPEAQSELEDYLQLEHILILTKARARQFLKVGSNIS